MCCDGCPCKVHGVCSIGVGCVISVVYEELETQPVENQEGHRDGKELRQQQTIVAEAG